MNIYTTITQTKLTYNKIIQEAFMSDKNNNNKKSKSKSEQNASYTGLPDIKTNASTSKNAVTRQGKIDGTIINDN